MLRVRKLGLMAGIAALLLQVIAWSWMSPVMGSARAGQSALLQICSAGGLTTVRVDPAEYEVNKAELGSAIANSAVNSASGGDAVPSKPLPFGTSHCPLCPLVAGLALPPPPASIGPVVVVADDCRPLPGDPTAAGWFLSTLQARAPPLPA